MFKFLALVVILAAVAVSAYPAAEEVGVQATKALPADGQADLATKGLEGDLEGGDGGDLKGSETFGFGYYPYYGRGYGYGGWGGGWGYGGGWGGYRHYGWGYPRYYYW